MPEEAPDYVELTLVLSETRIRQIVQREGLTREEAVAAYTKAAQYGLEDRFWGSVSGRYDRNYNPHQGAGYEG